MVAHHRIAVDLYGEDSAQVLHALDNPASAVIEVITCLAVLPAQVRAPHTTGNAVVVGRGFQ